MTQRTELLNFRCFWVLALSLSAFAASTGAVKAQPAQKWTDEEFEEWVFEDNGTAASNRRKFESLLNVRIEELDAVCHLTNEQKLKLQLMGAGDIKRVFDMYDTAKRHFNQLNNDPRQLDEVVPFSRPIWLALTNMFQEGSLLIKSLRCTLKDNQIAKYEVMARERREFVHKAQIELAVHTLERQAPLRNSQRRDLVALLTKEIEPIKTKPYGLYIVMYKISLLKDDKIKPILTDTQWEIWSRKLDTYKAALANLQQNGNSFEQDGIPDNAKEAPQK
jgi:hypothetical protein